MVTIPDEPITNDDNFLFEGVVTTELDPGAHTVTVTYVSPVQRSAASNEPYVNLRLEDDDGNFSWTTISLMRRERNTRPTFVDNRIGVLLSANATKQPFKPADFKGARVRAFVRRDDDPQYGTRLRVSSLTNLR